MTDDPLTTQEAVETLRRGVEDVARHVVQIPDAVNEVLTRILFPPEVREYLVWAATETVELVMTTLDNLHQLLVGAAAPVWFFEYASRWEELRGTTTGVTGALIPELMPAARAWTGPAREAYTAATGPQRDAVERISATAAKIDQALGFCGAAGASFYAGLAVVVTSIVASLVAAIAAIATGVGAPVGLGGLIASISVEGYMIVGLVATLTGVLAVQAQQMSGLQGEALDGAAFPGGHWPDPVTGSYDDGTVTDGDADWSLRR